ncbi:MAG: hypothetical protein K2H47_03520, partial [Muribaculaceae bacterium]|nr:hypothetical protein [Muribaculaceae bacterium]
MKRYGLLLIPLVYCVLWLLAAGCGRGVRHDIRLTAIERLSEEHSDTAAATAVSRLELIDRSALSGSDRRYYDFLRVKTADKAYITHTSDSLILSVIDYAASHRRELSYPEALYYGGRVYSDLGDYPTALRYFQQALDEMPESDDRKFLNLKGTVLSQTGRLLNTLRLYDEAISYIEKSLFTDSVMNDSVGLMYNTELLGAVYIGAENYDTAEIKLKQSFHIAEELSHDFRFVLLAQLAEIKYHQGFVDSALILLRPALKHIHKADSSYVLSCAAKIYHQAGILDTAFIYARELIWNKHFYNRAMGYEIITSPELIKFIPADSLPIYLSGHRSVMVNSLKKNESQQALIQNSRYNYQLHERERVKAESSRDRLRLWLVVIVLSVLLVISLLVGVIIYQKARNRKSLLRLHDALDRISLLRYSLDSKEICLEAPVSDSQTPEIKRIDSPLSETEQLRILKERLRKELMSL